MRIGSVTPACIVLLASVTTVLGSYPTTKPPQKQVSKEITEQQRRAPRSQRFFSFRSLASQVDNQVIANLLADMQRHANEVEVSVVAGEIARCETQTCQVPLNVRVDKAQGPVALTFAVSNPRGQISDVRHVECNTGDCAVSLILERGENTISIGVLDGIAQATGYATTRVNAVRNVADRGKSEWF